MFVLDTNVVSEFRRQRRGDPGVIRWAEQQDAAAFYISAITVMELEIGHLLVSRRDAEQGRGLRAWLDRALGSFAGRTLSFDGEVARICAGLHVPDRRSERDAIIAATALAHNMTVVTRNTQDFARTGVRLLNPWLERAF